ncbi:transposase [Escherichia coli]|uniref:transposase n=1 Tax=Escherichia coli TaxID=562 RepID=UPI003D6F0C85
MCRYISRPAVSEKTSGINRQWAGALRAQNSVPQWHHPCDLRAADFIAKLAALVPKPRVNSHASTGVFAPNSKHRVK